MPMHAGHVRMDCIVEKIKFALHRADAIRSALGLLHVHEVLYANGPGRITCTFVSGRSKQEIAAKTPVTPVRTV